MLGRARGLGRTVVTIGEFPLYTHELIATFAVVVEGGTTGAPDPPPQRPRPGPG
jgi:hypothetical protein